MREILRLTGLRDDGIHPSGLRPKGPARPHWTVHPSPGECDLYSNPAQADGTRANCPPAFTQARALAWNPETGLNWQGATCPLEPSCSARGNRKRPDPGLKARGLRASILSGAAAG